MLTLFHTRCETSSCKGSYFKQLALLACVLVFTLRYAGTAAADSAGRRPFIPVDLIEIASGENTVSCARRIPGGRYLAGVLKTKQGKVVFLTYKTKIARLKARLLNAGSGPSAAIARKLARFRKKGRQLDKLCRAKVQDNDSDNDSDKGGSLAFVDFPTVSGITANSALISFSANVETSAEINVGTEHNSENNHDMHAKVRYSTPARAASGSGFAMRHERLLTGLTANTQYHVEISVRDKKGRTASEHVHFATTQDGQVVIEFEGLGILRLREMQRRTFTIAAQSANGALALELVTEAPFADLRDNGDGTATLTLAPLAGTAGEYSYKLIARAASGESREVESLIKVYVELPPAPHPGEPGFYIAEHHDPFIPNFAYPEVTSDVGMNRVETTDDGNWSALFPGLPSNTALVIKHNIVFDTRANVNTVVVYPNGSLTFRTDRNTELKLVTLQVMHGGLLEIGRVGAPVQADVTAQVIFKDEPFNFDIDPAQYGHGLLNFGTVLMHGRTIERTFLRTARELASGDRSITLEAEALGWRAGDKLIFPDSSQLRSVGNNELEFQWEENEVASVRGAIVELARPLQFNHPGARSIAGQLDYLPHVANLGRNILLRSENPNGVRGHTVNFGHAHWDLRYVSFVELGRTLALDPRVDLEVNESAAHVDSTEFEAGGIPTRIGLNQIGRYAVHNHHAHGPRPIPASNYQQVMLGLAIDGSPKWGIVVHGTHFALVQDNVVYRARGAGIVTENGAETGNVIERNFVMRSEGSGQKATARSLGRVDFAHEGSGFWFHGSNNFVRRNVSANNRIGFNIFHLSLPAELRYPLAQGDDPLANGQYLLDPSPRRMQILEFNQNEAYSHKTFGFELWKLARREENAELPYGVPTLRNSVAWHNLAGGILAGNGQPNTFMVDGLSVRQALASDGECIGRGISSSAAYTSYIRVRNADIQGAEVALTDTSSGLIVEKSYLRNCTNHAPFKVTGRDYLFDNVKIDSIPGRELRGIMWQTEKLTLGSDRLYSFSIDGARNSRFLVLDHQQIPGNDYELFLKEQVPNYPMLGKGQLGVAVGCPEQNLTAGQCFQKYGFGIHGQVAPCSGSLPAGISAGAACENPPLDIAYAAAPRAYLTSVKTAAGGTGEIYGVVTGDPQKMNAGNSYMRQLNTLPAERVTNEDPQNRVIRARYKSLLPGEHTVQVWLVDKNLNEIPGSRDRMTFTILAD